MTVRQISFFILVLFSQIAEAQYMTDLGKSWNVLHTYKTMRTRNYEFVGDTLIKDTLFRQLHFSYSEKFDRLNSFFAGYIFDNHRGNVYIKYQTGDTYLLYDFTAQTGDTINMGKINATTNLEFSVDSVDYTTIAGKMTKKMYMHPIDRAISNKQIWIEGIGSMLGPVEVGEIQYFNYNTALLCMHRNDTIYYKGELWTCYFSNAPAQQKISISTSKEEPSLNFLLNADYNGSEMKLRIFDSEGHVVSTHKLKKNKPLELKNMKEGNYIIQLSDSYGRVYATKKLSI